MFLISRVSRRVSYADTAHHIFKKPEWFFVLLVYIGFNESDYTNTQAAELAFISVFSFDGKHTAAESFLSRLGTSFIQK